MSWKELEYSRSQVINSGKVIKADTSSDDELRHALQIIDNWRAAHSYPMHVIYMHLRRMTKDRKDIVVAERLKRLDSIINKLKHEPNMNLWTMQDLGGCRVIVPTINLVYEYANKLECSRIRHQKKNEKDYIEQPRSSGYRSLHHVYSYISDKKLTYNNMSIEVQFRTKLQHLWATAVETLGLSTNVALKAGHGDEDTKRFFELVSSIFAHEEGTPFVSGTPQEISKIIWELQELNRRVDFIKRLRAIRVAADHVDPHDKRDKGYYLLIMNLKENKLSMKFFAPNQLDSAVNMYNELEKKRNPQQSDAVLVRVASFNILKIAYPNYFSDIGAFVKKVESYISK